MNASPSSERPNILLLWTDEQRADTLAAYGNRHGVTPCLDRFAREATVFEHAYCTAPLCTPSRGSVLTGLYPHRHGARMNNGFLNPAVRCLPALLDGYEAGYIGKWHLGDEVFAQQGFSTWISIEDLYYPHFSPGRDRGARSDYHYWLLSRGHAPQPDRNVFPRGFIATLPESESKTRFVADRAIEFLRARRDARRPWFLSVNVLEPHMPFTGPRDGQYDPRDVPLPANALRAPDASCVRRHRLMSALQCRRKPAGCDPSDEASVRQTLARYWGLASQVDHHFGRILDALADSGHAENTIVVFTSDHGDQMGSHALITKGVFYEESVRVPLLIKLPGQRQGVRISAPVSQVDLAATLCDLAAAPAPSTDGISLRPVLEGGPAPDRDVILVWHNRESREDEGLTDALAAIHAPFGALPECRRALFGEMRGLVSPDGWKILFSATGECELYNRVEDPLELRNLAHDPACRARRSDLAARLGRWQRDHEDDAPIALT